MKEDRRKEELRKRLEDELGTEAAAAIMEALAAIAQKARADLEYTKAALEAMALDERMCGGLRVIAGALYTACTLGDHESCQAISETCRAYLQEVDARLEKYSAAQAILSGENVAEPRNPPS